MKNSSWMQPTPAVKTMSENKYPRPKVDQLKLLTVQELEEMRTRLDELERQSRLLRLMLRIALSRIRDLSAKIRK